MRPNPLPESRRRGRPPVYDLTTVLWWVGKLVRDLGITRTEARLRAAEKYGFGGAKEEHQITERVRNVEVRARKMWRRAGERSRTEPEPEDDEIRFFYAARVERGPQDATRDKR